MRGQKDVCVWREREDEVIEDGTKKKKLIGVT